MQNQKILDVVINALEDLKAKDIIVIDVHEKTSVTDYMVIATGNSNRQVKAIADSVVEQAKKNNAQPLGCEGFEAAEWALVDLGNIVVHVMQPEIRSFFDLERLWQGKEQGRVNQFSDQS